METVENHHKHEHEHHHRHECCEEKEHDDKDCRDDDDDKCKHRCHDDDDECKHRRHHKSHHIHELDETIKALADALAHLGRGAHLQELLRIIHSPGWTTPAELAFVNAILDHISVEVRTLDRLQADLVEASRKVTHKRR